MTTEGIIENITSRDTTEVCKSACEIINLGQDHNKIISLVKFLPLIREKTLNLYLGGMFASNQRFVDFAIKTIEFHVEQKYCYCELYVEKYFLTDDVMRRKLQYECFNPKNEVEKGNIKILETIKIEDNWIDYYIVECKRCLKKYRVEERGGHYVFWNWKKMDK